MRGVARWVSVEVCGVGIRHTCSPDRLLGGGLLRVEFELEVLLLAAAWNDVE